jgi:hypothetical protein
MAYCIFLKSLRSLEEYRKNPHVQIPPKSLCAIFQSLGKIQKSNLNSEGIPSMKFGPIDPAFSQLVRTMWPIPACAALAYLPKAASFSSLRSPAMTPSSSVSFVISPASADSKHTSPAPHRNWSPRASQPPSLRRQSKPLTPPPWFPLLKPR